MLRFTGLGEIVELACRDAEGLTPFEADADGRHEISEISREAIAGGWQMHVHAITDHAAGVVLDAREDAAQGRFPEPLRFMIAHADGLSARSLAKAVALDAVAAAPPLGDLIRLGVSLSTGTDATAVNSLTPWRSLWWFVTGRTLDGGPRRDDAHRDDEIPGIRSEPTFVGGDVVWATGPFAGC